MMNNFLSPKKDEISIKGESSTLFLEVIISIAVFLFAITMAGVMSINSMLGNWSDSIEGGFTVQVMPVNNADREKGKAETLKLEAKVVEAVKNFKGVEDATPLGDKKLHRLLKPWLGDSINLDDLPMPRLIDVKIDKDVKVDFIQMAEKLAEISPNTSLDSHKLWLSKLINFADGLRGLAIVTLALVFVITTGAIIYTTRTSLGLNKTTIEILHIMGAKDTYIAKKFSKKTGYISMFGGMLGIFIAVPTIMIISKLAEKIEGGIIVEAALAPTSWLLIAVTPVFYTIVSMMTAYYTVKSTLEKVM